MPLKVLIACGGTGGHLFPGIAVAESLRALGHETLALISEKDIDALASKGYGHLNFKSLPAVGMPRKKLSPAMLKFVFRYFATVKECKKIAREFGADAVIGMGGFTSLPPVAAGKKIGAKAFVHDSNAVPGKSNRRTATYCNEVFLGFEEAAKFFPGSETTVVGTPVRPEMNALPARADDTADFQLDPGKKTVLIIGGSQGARGVNLSVVDALPSLRDAGIQVIHFTGPKEFDSTKRRYDRVPGGPGNHYLAPFCSDMPAAYAAADIVVARSGASTLAELSYLGLPSVLVPYPYAADNHQMRNAEVFSKAEAAVLAPEDTLAGGRLAEILTKLFDDEAKLAKLSKNARDLSHRDAAGAIAERIIQACA